MNLTFLFTIKTGAIKFIKHCNKPLIKHSGIRFYDSIVTTIKNFIVKHVPF